MDTSQAQVNPTQRPAQATMHITRHGEPYKSVPLTNDRMVIGRSIRCEIRLESSTVSRQHAELVRDPFGRWWIRDMGSRNGTKVNGEVVAENVVSADDRLDIEEFSMRIEEAKATQQVQRSRTMSLAGSMTVAETGEARIKKLKEFETPKISAGHLTALNDFGSRLLETPDADRRLSLLCELMVTDTFRGRAALALRLPATGDIPDEPQGLIEPAQADEDETPYVSKTLLRAVQETGESALASNTDGTTGVVELSLAGHVMQVAAMVCPIQKSDEVLDVLYVTFPASYASGEWLAMAELAVRQFEQARLAWIHRKHAQQQAAIERELERARQIQYRFVPDQVKCEDLDVAFGFEPCRWVAGDFVDIVPLRDGRVLLTIADVCGKGLQASLITVSLHTMIHAFADTDLQVGDVFNRLNRYLIATLPENSFVTAAALTIDPKTGHLESVNAGHPPPFLFEPGQKPRQLMDWGNNLPLGLDDAPMEVATDTVEPDQLVFLYTDGLSELTSEEGQMLGIQGLCDQITHLYAESEAPKLDRFSMRISTWLRDFQANRLAADDQTYLMFRRSADV